MMDEICQGFLIHENLTVFDLLQKFISVISNQMGKIDFNQYSVYFEDCDNYHRNTGPIVIEDLQKSLNSFNSAHFNIFFEKSKPIYYYFSDEPIVKESNSFDEFLQNGILQYDLKNYQESMVFFNKARVVNPSAREPIIYHIKILMKTRRYNTANSLINTYYAHFAGDFEFLMLNAKTQRCLGHYDDSVASYRRILMTIEKNDSNVNMINTYIAKNLFNQGNFDQAYSLIESIVSSDPSSIKATTLISKILFKQGRFVEGLNFIIRNFSFDPYHKKSYSFLGQNIRTKLQSDLLLSELGDSSKNSDVLYFVAHSMYTFGNCEMANDFLKRSITINPNCFSYYLIFLKNKLALFSDYEEIKSFILSTISKLSSTVSDLVKGIDFSSEKNSDISSNMNQSGVFSFGQGKPSFSMNELDQIGFVLQLVPYFFTHGKISIAEVLCNNVQKMIGGFDMGRTLVSQDIRTFTLVSSLINGVKPIETNSKRIFLIGDDQTLVMAWKSIEINNSKYQLIPMFIDKISLDLLSSSTGSPQKTAFWKAISHVPDDSYLILCIGSLDSQTKYHPNLHFSDVESHTEAFKICIEFYSKILEKICSERKIKIMIHPVYTGSIPLFSLFNYIMSSRILEMKEYPDSLTLLYSNEYQSQSNDDIVGANPKYLDGYPYSQQYFDNIFNNLSKIIHLYSSKSHESVNSECQD